MRLAAHPSPAAAGDEAAEKVVAERSGLVAGAPPGGDGGDRPAVLRFAEDRLMAPGPFVAAALLDDEAEVHAAAAGDVLDRLAGPGSAMRHPLAVQKLPHLAHPLLPHLLPHS